VTICKSSKESLKTDKWEEPILFETYSKITLGKPNGGVSRPANRKNKKRIPLESLFLFWWTTNTARRKIIRIRVATNQGKVFWSQAVLNMK